MVFLSNSLPSTLRKKQHLCQEHKAGEASAPQMIHGLGGRHRHLRPMWGWHVGWWQVPGRCPAGQRNRKRDGSPRLCTAPVLGIIIWNFTSWNANPDTYTELVSFSPDSKMQNAKERSSSRWRGRKRISWSDFVFIIIFGTFKTGLERNENQDLNVQPSIEHLLHTDSMPALSFVISEHFF